MSDEHDSDDGETDAPDEDTTEDRKDEQGQYGGTENHEPETTIEDDPDAENADDE